MADIPYGRQSISEADIEAVVRVLRSDWLTQGPAVPAFEQALCDVTGAAFARAVSNATAGLHIACLALGLSPGKRLWTVSNTFLASANCGRYCGASVGFVDIDPRSYCLSVDALRSRLEQAACEGLLPDIVVAVDFAGQPCDFAGIVALKQEFGFRLIEDASHAIGATYEGARVGALPGVDCTVFSFHPVKLITTGEGGAVLTELPEVARQLDQLRSHGMVRDPRWLHDKTQGGWYYEQHSLGYNDRMTDLQAALGQSQLQRLPEFLARRRALCARYDQALAGLPLVLPWQAPATDSARHLYPVLLADAETRARVFAEMRGRGIGVQVHYLPVHLQPYYRALGSSPGDCPVAEAYSARTLSLPVFPSLSDAQQDEVVAHLKEILA